MRRLIGRVLLWFIEAARPAKPTLGSDRLTRELAAWQPRADKERERLSPPPQRITAEWLNQMQRELADLVMAPQPPRPLTDDEVNLYQALARLLETPPAPPPGTDPVSSGAASEQGTSELPARPGSDA